MYQDSTNKHNYRQLKVKLQMGKGPQGVPKDIRIQKASGNLHDRIEKYIAKIKYNSGEDLTKVDACVRLLETHPDIKKIKV